MLYLEAHSHRMTGDDVTEDYDPDDIDFSVRQQKDGEWSRPYLFSMSSYE